MIEAMKEFLQKYGFLIAIGFVIIMVITFFTARSLTNIIQPDTTYETPTTESIDFADENVKFHTAADGLALVAASSQSETQTEEKKPADPGLICQDTGTDEFKQFTMPQAVQMDDESIGVLTIPDIGLSVRAYESEDQMEDMTKGASHFKITSAFTGNIGLSAHNVNLDGSDGYFLNLHKLEKGAEISYKTPLGTKTYLVETVAEIAETNWDYLKRTDDNRITLITCISGKPTKRLCVQAVENIADPT